MLRMFNLLGALSISAACVASSAAQTVPRESEVASCPRGGQSVYYARGEASPSEQATLLITRIGEQASRCQPDGIDLITEIDTQISQLIRKQQVLYNPNWGQLMRAGNEESYFAYQMERYACVYMSKIGDLFDLSPRTYFRAPRRPSGSAEHPADAAQPANPTQEGAQAAGGV